MAYNIDFSKPLWETESFKNPYTNTVKFNKDEHYKKLVETFTKYYQVRNTLSPQTKRSNLDRFVDLFSTPLYATAGAVKGVIDKDTTVLEGVGGGLRAGLDFLGSGYEKGETTYSDVLESAGWKPESTLGKIAKGVVGFGLDVALDPLTYLTGGLGAAVRGTGKTAFNATRDVEKLASNIADDVFDITTKQLVDKGINPDLAERFAVKKAQRVMDEFAASGMNKEMAEAIIRKQGKTAEADIERAAERFAKEYNRASGLTKGADLTLGVRNFPFIGEKLSENAPVTLAKGEAIAEFTDPIFGRAYGKLRDSVYGTQIGKLFSTKTPLYQAAKTDPAKVYDLLRFNELSRGLSGDKLLREKALRAKAAELNFTPAETRQIMDMLEEFQFLIGRLNPPSLL